MINTILEYIIKFILIILIGIYVILIMPFALLFNLLDEIAIKQNAWQKKLL